MPDPPSPSYPALFFLFYPARRRSDRWAINELKRPSFFFGQPLTLSVRRTAACFAVTFAPPLVPLAQSPLRRRVFSLVLFCSPSNFSSLFFSSTHVHFFSLPVSSIFRVRSTLSARSPPGSDLSISISHSLPFPSVFSSPLSSSSTYLLYLLRLSSFSFLVQLAIPRSGETNWKLSFSHVFPSCVPPSPYLRPI